VLSTKSTLELDPLAAEARSRALAQANLLAMNLPNIQPSTSDLALQIYVGNLYYALTETDIRNVFAPFGTIRSITLSMEPGSGRSKGFCFIEYEDVLAAESAIQVLNGSELAHRAIKVCVDIIVYVNSLYSNISSIGWTSSSWCSRGC
jgi:hypothetical protein